MSSPPDSNIRNDDIGPPSAKKRPLRLLVAEDNHVNQIVIKGIMESFGHSVTLTANGAEVLKAFQASPFDLVLMDIQMPVMDGLSATLAIRHYESAENLPRTPVVGLTAHALNTDRDRCLKAGMDRHVAKPFNIPHLLAIVEELTS